MSKTGRNAPCPCGSGKKYKKCCLNKPRDEETQQESKKGSRRKAQLLLATLAGMGLDIDNYLKKDK